MNVRLYDQGVNTIGALEVALRKNTFTAGTIKDSFMSGMIDVCEALYDFFIGTRSP